MNKIVQTILGVVLLGVAAVLAFGAVTSKGAVVLSWPLASCILTFATIGGFLASKSLMESAIKAVADAARRARKSGTTPTP